MLGRPTIAASSFAGRLPGQGHVNHLMTGAVVTNTEPSALSPSISLKESTVFRNFLSYK